MSRLVSEEAIYRFKASNQVPGAAACSSESGAESGEYNGYNRAVHEPE